MSILTDLRAVLEADAVCQTSECRECSATECPCDQLRDMLFPANGKFDTIAALVAVAEAMHDENNSSGEAARQAYVRRRTALASLVKERRS